MSHKDMTLTSTKLMERPKCGEIKDLFIIQNIHAPWLRAMEVVSWIGLAWLLRKQAH